MKNILQFLNAGIILISIFSSCTIEKRKYQPGYNIQWNNLKPDTKRNDFVQNNKSVEGDKLLSAGKSDTDILLTDESATASQYILIINKKHKNEKSNHHFNFLPEDCDIIYLKNGVEIKAKVLEISQNEIKYKKCEDINGPIFILKKSEIFIVKYSNGTNGFISPDSTPETKIKPFEKEDNGIFGLLSFISIIAGLIIISVLVFSGAAGVVAYLIFALLAIVLGAIGTGKGRKLKGFAIVGLTIGIIALLILLLVSLTYPYN